MSNLTESFKEVALTIKPVTGEQAIERFLRLHRDTGKPTSSYADRSLEELLNQGHLPLAVHAADGQMVVGAVMLLPNRPGIVGWGKMVNGGNCVILHLTGLTDHFRQCVEQPLLEEACAIAAQKGYPLLLDEVTGGGNRSRLWDTVKLCRT